MAGEPPEPASPFFLVGAVRSGTTVLRIMLGHHPRICRCDEMEYVAGAIAGRRDFPDAHRHAQALPRWRDFRESGCRPDPSLGFAGMARDLLEQRRRLDGRPLVGATVHNEFDQLVRIWPDARFIHLARDPRDVARSCVEMGWCGNAWAGVAIWAKAHASWQRLRAQVPPERRLELRFEDLVRDAPAELARLCGFLGVPFDAAMLDIERDSTYRRPDPRGARSWRLDAPQREVREMEAHLGARLAEAGYAPSGLPPLRVTAWRRLALLLHHRLRRTAFACRRYGVALWTASFVTRRVIPLPRWRERSQRAIERIDRLHLK